MLSFDTPAAISAAPASSSIDPGLKRVLAARVADWTAAGLLDLTHLLILEPGDTEQAILDEVALSRLVNRTDGRRFPEEGFVPPFQWLSDVGGHWELIQTVGNSGFAFCIFIPDAEGTDPELRALCRAFANGGE
jgi:hypothetical protein